MGWIHRGIKHVKWLFGLTSEERSRRAVRQLRLGPDDIAIDCGANVGEMTTVMAETGATVHAFEPNPHACAVLRQKFADHPRVHIHEAAVHTAEGSLPLYLHENSEKDEIYWSNGSSLLADKPNVSRDRSVTVLLVDLGAFIMALPGRVRLLKMDIEGAEVEVLRDLLQRDILDKVDFLFVETHEIKMPWLTRATVHVKEGLAAHATCRARFDWV